MKRLAISFFYDGQGILDDYMVVLLRSMREHCERIVFVVNGQLTKESRAKVEPIVDEILVRSNDGFDVGAYRAGLNHIGFEQLKAYEEVILFNHTFYGPIFPFSEMFGTMEKTKCAMWGITAHKEVVGDPAMGREFVPFHLNSHFISFRKPILESKYFKNYWDNIPVIRSYEDSIRLHELEVTGYFQKRGFAVSSYVKPEDYGAPYAAFMEIDRTIEGRSPILKRRALFHDPIFVEEQAVDVARALDLVEKRSAYNLGLIWQNITRATTSRTLYTNASLLRVLPDVRLKKTRKRPDVGRIAVFAHAHYDELVPELLEYASNIPGKFDFICTTTDAARKSRIEAAVAGHPKIEKTIVRVVEVLCGRDMAALLVTCEDLLNNGDYDLICRLHTKKSPQVDPQKGARFKRHMLHNTVGSEGFVANLLDLFESNPRLGIVAPAMYHFGYPTPGHAWFVNRQRAIEAATRMGVALRLDQFSPIAVYGGMFWFRPVAVKKMLEAGWDYDDFEKEPHPTDGALAHALERLWVNVAADAGYVTYCVLDSQSASVSHTLLEYKLDRITGYLPTGDLRHQVELLQRVQPALQNYFLGEARHSGRALGAELHQAIEDLQNTLKKQKMLMARQAERNSETLRALEKRSSSIWSLGKKSGVRSTRSDIQVLGDYFNALCNKGAISVSEVPEENALAEYASGGFLGGKELTWLFDSSYYLVQNSDVADSGKNPLVHFVQYGWAERRNPHPLIDLQYAERLTPELADGDTPMAMYLLRGGDSKRRSHPIFDDVFYCEQYESELYGDALKHFLAHGARGGQPHLLFDPNFYRGQASWLETTASPLLHYMSYGWKMGLRPHPHFDPAFYIAAYGDVAKAGVEPLKHYLEYGHREDRNPNEGFDSRGYRRHADLGYDNPLSPLEHAMRNQK
ncbi:hypothetical protein GCM10017620_23040 [Brevundimonas intermedia]|uniref:Rhamnan synthesis protein F n=1 Tax=Brevundimonas intermedia TaxID=74315 RepID=A0ABQ5TC32_9CAUL|nr:rhamnan synthesis F family protein [Brevundimonas intermedia]GLK49331.1 hypothetical protein GCM10017620_23040 [Brevundimonas intermedia]